MCVCVCVCVCEYIAQNIEFIPNLQWLTVGVLRSVSADNRLRMFDRRSLKRPVSKKRSQAVDAPAVRGLTRHAAALSDSVRRW